jgi:uncharacterized protein YqgC (DUF456 family)
MSFRLYMAFWIACGVIALVAILSDAVSDNWMILGPLLLAIPAVIIEIREMRSR